MAPNATYDGLTERINFICYRLEHYVFLTAEDRIKLEAELKLLIENRAKLLEVLDK